MRGARTDDLTTVDWKMLDRLRDLAYFGNDASATGPELAEYAGIPAKSVGGRLVSLVKRGLIVGRRHPQTGRNHWTITVEGRRAWLARREEGNPWEERS